MYSCPLRHTACLRYRCVSTITAWFRRWHFSNLNLFYYCLNFFITHLPYSRFSRLENCWLFAILFLTTTVRFEKKIQVQTACSLIIKLNWAKRAWVYYPLAFSTGQQTEASSRDNQKATSRYFKLFRFVIFFFSSSEHGPSVYCNIVHVVCLYKRVLVLLGTLLFFLFGFFFL